MAVWNWTLSCPQLSSFSRWRPDGTVMRFTRLDVNERPGHVIRTIRAMWARLAVA
jgi:hypothetical protein